MNNYTIIIDSREQKPLWRGKKYETKKLDVGDYSIKNMENRIAIERKSLPDLFGTVTKGHTRFKAEIQRAKKLDYFALVIEGSFSDCVNKNFEAGFRTKMKGYIVAKIVTTIHIKYNIPIFWCTNRVEAKAVIKELFNSYYKIYNK